MTARDVLVDDFFFIALSAQLGCAVWARPMPTARYKRYSKETVPYERSK
jgi:hypothetical protein